MPNETIEQRLSTLASGLERESVLEKALPGLRHYILFSFRKEGIGSKQGEHILQSEGLMLYSVGKQDLGYINSGINIIPEERFKFDMEAIAHDVGWESLIEIYTGEPITAATGGGSVLTLRAPNLTYEELAKGLHTARFS